MAAMQAVDAVEQGRHLVVEGEPGSGRRLLARSAWNRRSPGAPSLFTLDCRIFNSDGAESLLFGERSSAGSHTTIRLGKLSLAMGGGLLLLHAEYLPLKTQGRLAQTLGQFLLYPRGQAIQLLMTCAPSLHAPLSLHPELAALLVRVRVPALRERVEDIRAIAEAFLRNVSPFDAIRCSQALIDKFCAYSWPGNITELRSVLRRLLLEPHNGLLDVRHLADLMCRDESCFSLLQVGYGAQHLETVLHPLATSPERSSLQ
jgi:two-component system nitrogen regulation response regulator NtrX